MFRTCKKGPFHLFQHNFTTFTFIPLPDSIATLILFLVLPNPFDCLLSHFLLLNIVIPKYCNCFRFFVSVIASAVSEISQFARFSVKRTKSPRCPIFKFFVVTLYMIWKNLAPMPAPVNLFSIFRPLRELWL